MTGTILDQLAEHARERAAAQLARASIAELSAELAQLRPELIADFAFGDALARPELSFICEVKKASPSKGIIAQDFPYLEIAADYRAAGADAISVLTEPKWFLGSLEYLREITARVSRLQDLEPPTPCLRKDFTVHEVDLYHARLAGASAILLIVAMLDDAELQAFSQLAADLGLSALVEVHDEQELERALNIGAKIIGVNNRNLKTFSVNPENSLRLKQITPSDVTFVAESGISQPSEVRILREAGVDALLIGESLMRAENRRDFLQQLRAAGATSD